MANQGCPNEGDDTRWMGWLLCPIQRFLKVESNMEPATILFGFPFFISINIPLFWRWREGHAQTPEAWGFVRVLHWHAGIRYDRNGRIYLMPAWSLKTTDRAFFY